MKKEEIDVWVNKSAGKGLCPEHDIHAYGKFYFTNMLGNGLENPNLIKAKLIISEKEIPITKSQLDCIIAKLLRGRSDDVHWNCFVREIKEELFGND